MREPKFTIFNLLIFLLGFFLLISTTTAIAGTASSTMGVSTTVVASCRISSNAQATNGALSVACLKNKTARISFNQGGNVSYSASNDTPATIATVSF